MKREYQSIKQQVREFDTKLIGSMAFVLFLFISVILFKINANLLYPWFIFIIVGIFYVN